MAYLTYADARSLAVRFSRGIPLIGVLGSGAINFEVEIVMEEILLYFWVIDALALAYENRVIVRGNEDSDADHLSQGV